MPLAPLHSVQHRIAVGARLPFDVYDADRTLLLARGQRLTSQAQLDALVQRGCLAELGGAAPAPLPRAALARAWADGLDRVARTLSESPQPGLSAALDEAAAPVLSLIERDPDLAIFQVLQQGGGADVQYGARRALHTAITAHLVATRLAWGPADCTRAFKVALTMNSSMFGLQGELARQTTPPTPAQRQVLGSHPMLSVQLLQQSGVTDPDWLQAVLQHHEREDGTGYPSGRSDVCELAGLVRRAEVYTAKLSSRSTREALAADVAGRQLFMDDPGHPLTAALVKEFGIYPPGCHVRLASGVLAIVVARGPTITTPVVACLTTPSGRPLPAPERRDTTRPETAIVGVVGEGSVSVRASLDQLLALA